MNCKQCIYEPDWENIEDTTQFVGFCKFPIPSCVQKSPIYTFHDEPMVSILNITYDINLKKYTEQLSPIEKCPSFKNK